MLTDFGVYLDLQKPETRKIVRSYANADFRRLDKAVYSKLEISRPQCKEFLDEYRNSDHDPIKNIEDLQTNLIGNIFLLNLVEVISDVDKGDAISKARLCLETCKEFYPTKRRFYSDLAHAVREVAEYKSIEFAEAVELPHMDEVTRLVFQTRQEAESYSLNNIINGRKINDILFELLPAENKSFLLDRESMDDVEKLEKEYMMSEYDRVYAVL